MPPPNDNFTDAQWIAGTHGVISGTLYNSSREPGEPAVGGQEPYGTVWYRWTAPGNGRLLIESSSVMASSVYTGDAVTQLTPVYQQGFGDCLPDVQVSSGVTYSIAVTSFRVGDFSLPFSCSE